MAMPALCAPPPTLPVFSIRKSLNEETPSTKYNSSPTASLSNRWASEIFTPVALISIVASALPGLLLFGPPVPDMFNPSIVA